MRQITKFAKETLCWVLSLTIALQPNLVEANSNVITVDPATPSVKVEATINGTPLLQITAPNASGLSHNKFSDFNVGKAGLVINNALQNTTTQTGGAILANPNFNGAAASLILNEVTSANRSSLSGFTEIAGQKADYILANPNGITCNGCGFINTSRSTLTTGTPVFNATSLDSLSVNSGDILVDSLGLNANESDAFDIITRAAKISGAINAQDLRIISGRNDVKYADRSITKKADDASVKPTLAIDSSALGGMYAGRIALIANEAGVGVNMQGDMAASTSDLNITADGRIEFKTASAKNDLTLSSQTSAKIATRAYGANNLKIEAPTLDATGATLGGGNNVTLSGTTLSASNAQIVAGLQSDGSNKAQGDVAITANGGSFAYDGATIRAGQHIDIKANQVTGGASSNGITSLGNTTIEGTTSATLSGNLKVGGNLLLKGGALSTTTGTGDITGTTTINAASYSGTNALESGGNITVTTTGDTTINTGGALTSSGSLQINAANITSDGTLSSQTGTTLVATQSLTTTANAKTQSAQNTTLTSSNDMTLGGTTTATNALSITAPSLTNNGTIADGTTDGATINLSANLTNTGLIYAAGNMKLIVPMTLKNDEGQILAGGNIQIDKDGAGSKNTKVWNYSGQIESLNGGITINTAELLNERKGQNLTPSTLSSTSSSSTTGTLVLVSDNSNPFGYYCSPDGGPGSSCSSTKSSSSTVVTQYTATYSSNASKIISSKNMQLAATSLTNKGGYIATNENLDISGTTFLNTGQATYKKTASSSSSTSYEGGRNEGGSQIFLVTRPGASISSETTEVITPGDTFITAGGNITGSFADKIDNISIKKGVDPVTITAGSANVHATSADIGTPTSETINAGLSLPTGSGGLFVQSKDPTSDFIIETNPAVATIGALYGSSYFEQKLGVNLAAEVKRLGNDDYETRLVRDQIMATTHKRFLASGIGSDSAQYKALMDNAIAQKDDLQLSYGVALSKAQIAKLSDDLVWMVEVDLQDGRKALKPVVYFAQATRMAIDSSGAIIKAGGNLNLTAANDITNAGTLSGANTTLTSTNGSLTNSYGKLEASNGDLTITADQDITNTGGLITGTNVALTTTNGDFTNTTQTRRQSQTTLQDAEGVKGNTKVIAYNDVKAAQARIQATNGDLKITTGKSITDFSGSIKAKGNTTLKAGNDVQMLTVTTGQRSVDPDRTYESTETRTEQGTQIEIGNSLNIEAAQNIIAKGAQANIAKDLNMVAGQDIAIVSAQVLQTVRHGDHGTGQIWSKAVNHDLAQLKAGGNLSLTSGLDTIVNGANLEGGNDVTLSSLASTTLNSVQDSFEQNIKTKKYTLIVDKKDTVRSSVTAGNDVKIQSTLGDVTLKAVDIKAGGKVTLAALNGDVNLRANKDVDFRHEVKTKTGGLWTTVTDQGRLDEKVQHTTIDAGDGLTITVGTNGSINVDYKDFGDLDKSVERLSQEPGLEWMADVKAGLTDVQWNAVKENHKSWSTSNKSLSGAATIMITMIATVVTMGAGSIFAAGTSMANLSLGGMAASGMGLSGPMAAAVTAGINSLAISAAVSTVANKGNPLAVMKDMASKENLRSLAATMVTAGLLQGALGSIDASLTENASGELVDASGKVVKTANGNWLTATGKAPTLNEPLQNLQLADKITKIAINVSIATATQVGINGQDVDEAFKASAISNAQQLVGSYVFDKIGDLGTANQNIMGDGSPLKAIAHGVAGGFIAEMSGQEFSAGAISAAATELMSGALAEVDPNLRIQMAGMIGATAVMLTGGSAEDMQIAQTIAQSVMLYNHAAHEDLKALVKEKFAENGEEYDKLNEENIQELLKLCGEAHCGENGSSSLDKERLIAYLNSEGISYDNQTIDQFEEFYTTTTSKYFHDLTIGNIRAGFNGTSYAEELTFYVPDENDQKAYKLAFEKFELQGKEFPTGYDVTRLEEITSQIEAAKNNDPAMAEAFEYLDEFQTKAMLWGMFGVISEVAPHTFIALAQMARAKTLMQTQKEFLTYDKLIKNVKYIDVSTADNTAVFYSGRGAREVAEQFADANSLTTLETTQGGKWLDDLKLFESTVADIDQNKAYDIWGKISSTYANNARGTVHAVINNPNPEGIFLTEELPKLLSNTDVSDVIIRSVSGKETVITKGTSLEKALEQIIGF